jgi:serine/threonine protein kinase
MDEEFVRIVSLGAGPEGVISQVLGDERWVEVTPSQFPHETEGLNLLRNLLPDEPPFRVWTNFEFRDDQGKWHEVDAIVLGRRRMHLVELKYYSGTLRGNDHQWLRDGHRAEDSPLKLARRKAQRLASRLQDELRRLAHERQAQVPDARLVVPYIQESVFLHHPHLHCSLPMASRQDLFCPDGLEHDTGLPSITSRLLEPAEANPRYSISTNRSEIIAQLMERIGAVQRRQREAGSWIIDDQPLDEGEGWQDWPAYHRVSHEEQARIRFLVSPAGTSPNEQRRRRQVAEHEFRAVRALNHDGIVRPTDLVDAEFGIGLVYPRNSDYRRLDLWLAEHPEGVALAAQLDLLRQVGEAIAYAHRHKIVHRDLTPSAILVRDRADGSVQALVGDWQTAASAGGTNSGVEGRLATLMGSSLGELVHGGDAAVRGVYQAPEGAWLREVDRIKVDVFGLGAVAYFLLTRRAPAADTNALRERLQRDKGLDLAADLPQVLSSLRALVLDATRPTVGDRVGSMTGFLDKLADVERAIAEPQQGEEVDPLKALPGTVFHGRYRLQRRLGTGSTAVALLTSDEQDDGKPAVIKVALDDAAGIRLASEAEVLRGLSGPRIARLQDGPFYLGDRNALVVQFAGEQTLADLLTGRGRLSLDLLERYGSDLLEAVVALEGAGIDHRDIKPANLGLHINPSDSARHLMLFDFSLAREDPRATGAGTLGYRDPWLGTGGRTRFDSAAERYSAAVVLYEMGAGQPPTYGDGESDPVASGADLVNPADRFDPVVAAELTAFFARALAPSAAERFDTAAQMLAVWTKVFVPVPPAPDDAEQRAAAATVTSRLEEAGLSVRARSALEPFGVATVGDLIALDPVQLNRMRGAADVTRKEVKSRAKQWRDRLGADKPPVAVTAGLPTPRSAALMLAEAFSGEPKSKRASAVRMLLGLEGAVDAFLPQGDLGEAVKASRQRGLQLITEMQRVWADNFGSRQMLDLLRETVDNGLHQLGGVATIAELTAEIRSVLSSSADADEQRAAEGLLRVALDRVSELDRADALDEPFSRRRRDGRLLLLATRPELITAAELLSRAADDLVSPAETGRERVIPSGRVAETLRAALTEGLDDQSITELFAVDTSRLARLGAALSRDAALAGNGSLYSRSLPLTEAVALTLSGLATAQTISAQEIRDRVRARFPALAPVPDRPRLDAVLDGAGLRLVYDDEARVYRSRDLPAHVTGLHTRISTVVSDNLTVAEVGGHVAARLRDSVRSRSFLALGVDAQHLDRAIALLASRHNATVVDVTQVLLDSMQLQATQAGLPWETVRAADAAAPGTRDAQGLAALVTRALPKIRDAIERAATSGAPVLIAEVAPLARYGHLSTLALWTDLTAARSQPIWLLVPQLHGTTGPLIDGKPLPLGAPGQFVRVDSEWLASTTTDHRPEGASL